MNTTLEGRIAIVTGAATGIGRAVAEALAAEGAAVALAGLEPDAQQSELSTLELIERAGGTASWLRTDVRQPDEVDALVRATTRQWGRVDIVVNSAGVLPTPTSSVEQPLDVWDEVLDTNLRGTWIVCRAVIQQMLRQEGPAVGSIVNISSRLALSAGGAGRASYCASKAAVSNLTRQLAVEYGRRGIRTNAVCPGFIPGTGAELTHDPSRVALAAEQTPSPRLGLPEDVAAAVVFLASDASGFINGHNLVIDGGASARP